MTIPLTIRHATAAAASRRGVRACNCDGHTVAYGADGTTAAAVVDGIGNSPEIAAMADVLATVIARTALRRGGLAALLTAGEVIADPGPYADTPDAVAVVAVAQAGDETRVAWCGDSRIYGFDGERVRQYSTDATVGEQLRRNGVAIELAAEHDNWLKVSLSRATVGTVYTAFIPEDELVLLCSDGVVDGLPAGRLDELVLEYADDVQALADALVNQTEPDTDGYRDDATAVILQPPP
jgi:serine/threonine protein phosphatase PrpC